MILLALLLMLGGRLHRCRGFEALAQNAFWVVPLLLGVLIWGIYATVNTEERYVTVAYLDIILTLFATLVSAARQNPYIGPRTAVRSRWSCCLRCSL